VYLEHFAIGKVAHVGGSEEVQVAKKTGFWEKAEEMGAVEVEEVAEVKTRGRRQAEDMVQG
jgi:hypothetical protein